MTFDRYQHSIEQLLFLNNLANQGELSREDAFYLASELVAHGFCKLASELVDRLWRNFTNPAPRRYLQGLISQIDTIQAIPDLDVILRDQSLVNRLLDTEHYVFVQGTLRPEKLIIVFCTGHNNFYVSVPVLHAMLSKFGFSILYLKDVQRAFFLKGATGLGSTLNELTETLMLSMNRWNIERAYFMGFSSSGYASLFAAAAINRGPHLGFSVGSDYSEGSPLDQGKLMTAALKDAADSKTLVSIADWFSQHGYDEPCRLYFGDEHETDRAHAVAMAHLPNVTIEAVPDVAHMTPARLIELGRFSAIVSDFLAH